MEDLFNNYEALPQEVQDVLEAHSDCEGYEGCRALIDALEPLGYTCGYGLDGIPYELRKLRNLETYRAFIEWKNSDNVINTGKDEYRTQDSQYRIAMNKKELYKYFKKEFVS